MTKDNLNADLSGLKGSEEILQKNSELETLKSKINMLMESQEKMFEMINKKGADVGLPRRIRDDINELIRVINKLDNVWEYNKTQERRKDLENDVAKLINKGDVTSAFLKVSEELRVYKEDMIGVRMFLNMLTFKLNHLDNELSKHEAG